MRDGFFVRAARETEENLVGVLEAERNYIAVLQLAALHFFAVDEEPAALPAILNVKTVSFDDDSGAVARDATVGKLEVVAGFRASAHQKGRLCHADVAARAVRRDDFKNGFFAWENRFRHRYFQSRHCSTRKRN